MLILTKTHSHRIVSILIKLTKITISNLFRAKITHQITSKTLININTKIINRKYNLSKHRFSNNSKVANKTTLT